ncbi:MAG TPA: RluA family pseudouridine synthase [Candidatus Saccharimonadales bacterium]|nr:RluA family pseudouridine synthase [Candidatus Saccharimonadales bacterium]
MKSVPFYGNHEDNNHCAVAVYRMLFDHFLHRQLSWEEADKLAGYKDHKAAWTVTIWERMSNIGFDIRMIEQFDYRRYAKEGTAYLHEYLPPEEYAWQIEHANLLDILPYIPRFLEKVHVEGRRPTLQDIDDMLEDDRLVFLTLNSRVLDNEPGFASHAVLILKRDGDDYIMHDPGSAVADKQFPNRRVSRQKVWQAMGAEQSTSEATGIKLRPRPVRADILLATLYPDYSRAALAKLFGKGLVTHDGKVLKAGDKIKSDTLLRADVSSLAPPVEPIDLPVLYEDDDVIAINKPAGILTHAQSKTLAEATVATFLRSKSKELESGERAGVVHRLDRATSGVIIGAKNQHALKFLQAQFAKRTVKKTYLAIVEGHPKQPEAAIDMPIERNPKAPATFRVGANGKPAVTNYKVLRETARYSLLELQPQTGRTHQLRVHLQKIGHPIVGDPLYGHGKHGERLFLHAYQLAITLPDGEHKTFTAPLPPEFEELLNV